MIKNKIDGKKYYGSAKNINKRWVRHKNDLNKNQHQNIKLQRAWNKYGSDNFQFIVLEECSFDELLITEQKYLNQNPEYNIGKKSSGGDNLTNNPNRKKIIKKIVIGLVKKYKNQTEEEKKERSENLKGDKNPNWRGGTSVKYCPCGTQIHPNNKTCRKCFDITGKNNPNYGKQMTEEQKNYYRELFKGRCLHNNNKEIIIEGVEYKSFKDAERMLGINWGTIRWRVMSKNKKFDNYRYKD
jgi:group I intron endonuclease